MGIKLTEKKILFSTDVDFSLQGRLKAGGASSANVSHTHHTISRFCFYLQTQKPVFSYVS